MDITFKKYVEEQNVKQVRRDLVYALLIDPRGKDFGEMLKFAKERMPNLFEENKEANYTVPETDLWDNHFLFIVKTDLLENFSIEKLAFYQAVIEKVGKAKAEQLNAEEKESIVRSTVQSQSKSKKVVKLIPATVTTGGAVLTIVGICLGKTLLTLLGGAVLVGGVMLILNDNK